MRFEDRVTVSCDPAAHARKWLRYWLHLNEQGFGMSDPVYRYFAGEVFHDGELAVRCVDLAAQTVILRLRNVHAIDAITADDSYRANPFAIDRADFETEISFRGVVRFHIRTGQSIRQPIYRSSQLSKAAGKTMLQIAFSDETNL